MVKKSVLDVSKRGYRLRVHRATALRNRMRSVLARRRIENTADTTATTTTTPILTPVQDNTPSQHNTPQHYTPEHNTTQNTNTHEMDVDDDDHLCKESLSDDLRHWAFDHGVSMVFGNFRWTAGRFTTHLRHIRS